jgi:hypothetical protein
MKCFCGGKNDRWRLFFLFCFGRRISKPRNKLLSFIGVTCPTYANPPRLEFCDNLWGSLAPGAHKLFCTPGDRGKCCEHYPAKCMAHRRCQLKRGYPLHDVLSAVVDVFERPGRCLSSTSVLPLRTALYHIHNYFRDITRAPYPCTNWWWTYTSVESFIPKNQIISYFHTWPCFHYAFHFNTHSTATWHAYSVLWWLYDDTHHLLVPITWWYSWSDDAVSRETSSCCLKWHTLVHQWSLIELHDKIQRFQIKSFNLHFECNMRMYWQTYAHFTRAVRNCV